MKKIEHDTERPRQREAGHEAAYVEAAALGWRASARRERHGRRVTADIGFSIQRQRQRWQRRIGHSAIRPGAVVGGRSRRAGSGLRQPAVQPLLVLQHTPQGIERFGRNIGVGRQADGGIERAGQRLHAMHRIGFRQMRGCGRGRGFGQAVAGEALPIRVWSIRARPIFARPICARHGRRRAIARDLRAVQGLRRGAVAGVASAIPTSSTGGAGMGLKASSGLLVQRAAPSADRSSISRTSGPEAYLSPTAPMPSVGCGAASPALSVSAIARASPGSPRRRRRAVRGDPLRVAQS